MSCSSLKLGKWLKHSPLEDVEMTNQHTKRSLSSKGIRDMETQTVMKYPLCDNSDNNSREESVVNDFGKLECYALLEGMKDAASGSVEQN